VLELKSDSCIEERDKPLNNAAENQTWTLLSVLKEAAAYLELHKIGQPRLNAEQILSHMLGISRIECYLQFEKPLKIAEREQYKVLLRRRAGHEPLQYITGETEFMSLPFKVTTDVLIPRPETEILVEKAIDRARQKSKKEFTILDIGTGSGCIAVSLASFLTHARITAIDQSEPALRIAKANAILNTVSDRIVFQHYDIMVPLDRKELGSFDLIVSNPPYIRTEVLKNLDPEIKDHEPVTALDGGPDGLNFYKQYAMVLPDCLRPSGAIFLEIGADQGHDVIEIFKNGPWADIRIFQDLAGLDRVVMLEYA
jgi:release factor glutamine methyltransferase